MKNNIKIVREQKNLTQKDCADIFGVTLRAWQTYEQGVSEPKYEVLCKIADFFNVTLDYLLGREPPDDPLEVMGIKVRDVDDDAFIKMYRELPDNAKCVFLDVMKKLAGAAVQESGNTAPEYGPMKHSAVTGDIIADAEAEKDA